MHVYHHTMTGLRIPHSLALLSCRQGRLETLMSLYREKNKRPRQYKVMASDDIDFLFYSPNEKDRFHEDSSRWADSGHMKDRSKSSFLKEVRQHKHPPPPLPLPPPPPHTVRVKMIARLKNFTICSLGSCTQHRYSLGNPKATHPLDEPSMIHGCLDAYP